MTLPMTEQPGVILQTRETPGKVTNTDLVSMVVRYSGSWSTAQWRMAATLLSDSDLNVLSTPILNVPVVVVPGIAIGQHGDVVLLDSAASVTMLVIGDKLYETSNCVVLH